MTLYAAGRIRKHEMVSSPLLHREIAQSPAIPEKGIVA
ncbi:hypothetical protein NY78_2024 [Desulfovibrio sp. TomC]|nr:hypothetical protein NY78_2024 [Desulfovibrio sp. TomC]